MPYHSDLVFFHGLIVGPSHWSWALPWVHDGVFTLTLWFSVATWRGLHTYFVLFNFHPHWKKCSLSFFVSFYYNLTFWEGSWWLDSLIVTNKSMWRSGKLSGGDSFYSVLLKEPSWWVRSWAPAEPQKILEIRSLRKRRVSTKQKLKDLICISSYLRTVINYFLKSLEIEKAVSFSCCCISVLLVGSLRMNIPSQSHIVYTHLHVFMQMMCNLCIFLGSYLASFSYYILLIFLSSLLVWKVG